VRLFVEYMRKI